MTGAGTGTQRRKPPITHRKARRIAQAPGGRELLARMRALCVACREEARTIIPAAINPGGDPVGDVIRGLQLKNKADAEQIIRETDAEIRAIDSALGVLQA